MSLFSNFCNICYKIDNESLRDISEENMKHLNSILIAFVGHADIINYNANYLCQLCCEELTRVDKFRQMCLSNLIQMRQRYINMKLEDNTCAVQNTLQKFVYEEVLRKSSLEKNTCPVSISTNCHGIIKSPEYVNKDYLVFNRQVANLQLETNECDIKGACSEVSGINSVTEYDESGVAVTNEEDIKNEMLTRSENTRLEKFEKEPDEDYDVSDANNDNKSDTSQVEFKKEEYDLKNERENSDSENFTLKNDENESGAHASFDVKVSFVYNSGRSVIAGIACAKEELNVEQENSAAMKSLELQTMEDGFGDGLSVAFQIANVSTIVNMEEREHANIRSEDAEVGMKLRSRGSNKLTAATINTQSNRPQVRQYRNRRCSKTRQSDAHSRIYPSVEAHSCAVCNKSFRTSSCLTRHASTHNDGRRYKCTGRNKTVTNSSNLNTHKSIHSDTMPYKCTVCNKMFKHSGELDRHERIHSGDRPFKCTVCNKTFMQSSHLATHIRIHSGDRPYQCTACNKTFKRLTHLTTHKRLHSGAMPYKCTVCNKTFKHSGTLAVHERMHSGDRPYICTVCNKTFTQWSHLSTHKRIHSGDRPYKCTVCNKTFMTSSHLTTHERIHSGHGPYKCSVCNKMFTRLGNLTTHERIHTGHRPYKCTVCNKTFTQSSNLTTHKRTHSDDRAYKCTVCNKTFKYSSNLTTHKRIHST